MSKGGVSHKTHLLICRPPFAVSVRNVQQTQREPQPRQRKNSYYKFRFNRLDGTGSHTNPGSSNIIHHKSDVRVSQCGKKKHSGYSTYMHENVLTNVADPPPYLHFNRQQRN